MLASTLEADHHSCSILRVRYSGCVSEFHQPHTHHQSLLQYTCSAGKCAVNIQDPCSCLWDPIWPCFLLLANTTMCTCVKPLLLHTHQQLSLQSAYLEEDWESTGQDAYSQDLCTCRCTSFQVCLQPVPITTQHLHLSVYTTLALVTNSVCPDSYPLVLEELPRTSSVLATTAHFPHYLLKPYSC